MTKSGIPGSNPATALAGLPDAVRCEPPTSAKGRMRTTVFMVVHEGAPLNRLRPPGIPVGVMTDRVVPHQFTVR